MSKKNKWLLPVPRKNNNYETHFCPGSLHQLEILFTCEDPMEEFYPSSTIQSSRYFCRGRNNELSEGFLIRSRLTLLLFVRVACCGPCVLLPHQACSRANGPLVSGPPPGPESLPRHRTHLPPCSRPPSNGAYFEKWGS